jgi:alkylation response protein AidB-like acyl-CoA dehydrogenase
MSLLLNDEQTMLREAAASFLAERSPVAAQRRLRDAGQAPHFDEALWREVAAMGWTAAALPEEAGGLGAGWKGLGAVFEHSGRHLAALPLLSSVVLGASLVHEAGSAAQQAAWLPRLLDGSARLALALDEQPRHAPHAIACRAVREAGAWVIEGDKRDVLDGVGADALVVAARLPGDEGLGLFIVPAGTPGLQVAPRARIDSRNCAHVALRQVRVDDQARLCASGDATQVLDTVLDRARVCLAAESLGLARAAFEMTVDYLKQRIQFEVPIGSFQALQHRAARLYAGLELLESAVAAALEALDERPEDVAMTASLAKAKASELGELVLNEAVQMHGGIGVTDEFDLGLYLKRMRVLSQTFGDAAFHRDRWARLSGF